MTTKPEILKAIAQSVATIEHCTKSTIDHLDASSDVITRDRARDDLADILLSLADIEREVQKAADCLSQIIYRRSADRDTMQN